MTATIDLLNADRQRLGGVMLPVELQDDRLFAKDMRIEITIVEAGILSQYSVSCPDLSASVFMPLDRSVVERGQIWSIRFVTHLMQFKRILHGV